MTKVDNRLQFKATLLEPEKPGNAQWAFVVLPKNTSEMLSRRGRITVNATINGLGFQTTLEPDGLLSHWLQIPQELLAAAGASTGEVATFAIAPLEHEPEPEVPMDLGDALAVHSDARAVWEDTTSLARLDWIHWITTAKQAKTRAKRISDACDKLSSGQRRVCCFDPSGYYSKAFCAPKAVN